MAIHLYKTSTPSTRNGAVDSQVKSNPRNNLIYGQHHCGKGRNARGIITVRHRGGGHKRLYRKIDFRRNTKDIYYVHHANISNSLRRQAEEQMKSEEENAITGATVTLELGIDLGKLDRIVQTGSPFTVSSFVQRLRKKRKKRTTC